MGGGTLGNAGASIATSVGNNQLLGTQNKNSFKASLDSLEVIKHYYNY